jgi:hypothetical protein
MHGLLETLSIAVPNPAVGQQVKTAIAPRNQHHVLEALPLEMPILE